MKNYKTFLVFCLMFVVSAVGATLSPAYAFTVPTAGRVLELFNLNWLIIAALWSVFIKYVVPASVVPNVLIPYLNVAIVVFGKLATLGTASAATGVVAAVPDALGVLVSGFTNAVWARQWYEAFGRPLLEGWLKLKKA
jgi:hypothetical protein